MAEGTDRGSGDGDDPTPLRPPTPSPGGQLSAEERTSLLKVKVRELTRENRSTLRSQGDFDAVLVRGQPTNHLVMVVILACIMAVAALGGRILGDLGAGALAAVVLGGIFGLVWLSLALTGGEEVERLSIDQRGVIASVKSGRSVDARGDFIKVAAPCVILLICAFLGFSLARDIVNPPPPNCNGDAAAIKDTDTCIALPNLGGLLGGAQASASPGSSATGGGSASAGSGGWTVGSERLVERLVRSLQLLVVAIVVVVATVFLDMMLAGEWVFGIRPVRRRRDGS
ncbi:MAG TPA: hypothetical protein VIK06_08160 [Candidatus Limnocylindrales bacterium]